MKKLSQWVLWKKEKRAGEFTKIPYQINGLPASSTNPDTWSTYDEVKKLSSNFSGIGFVVTKESGYIFIDFDHCLNDKQEITNPLFLNLYNKAKTYTEISPSGDGLHLFFYIDEKFEIEANRSKKCPGFEIYNHGRYATFTENIYKGNDKIRKITPKSLNNLLKIIGYPWKEVEDNKEYVSSASNSLSDDVVFERMFKSKNGNKIRNLYNGDISEYNNDDSSADIALCLHLAFWFKKDSEKIRQVWLDSPLGKRKKTQTRKDYQDRTIKAAIEKCSDIYTAPEISNQDVDGLKLQRNDKGHPFTNVENVKNMINHDSILSSAFRFNDFTKMEETNISSNNWEPLEKHHFIEVMTHIQRNYKGFEKISYTNIEHAVLEVTYKNKVNEVRDYFMQLEWDGEHRLNHWLTRTFGTVDDEYHSAVGANWLKGLVKRVMEPGCQFDYVLALWGQQGLKKTTSLRTLGEIAGDQYHVETTINVNNKDFYLLLFKNLIVEFSEGETLTRSENKALKSIITTRIDQVRLPYGRNTATFPRHCVFAMTTNDSQFLKDDTGNRRWLPVEVTMLCDIEWLAQNRDQLYAEAYHRVMVNKENVYDFPEEETIRKQEERMVENPYQSLVTDWYLGLNDSIQEEGITTIMAYQAVYQQGAPMGKEMPHMYSMIIAQMFKNILHLDRKRIMNNGVRNYVWLPSEKTREIIKINQDYKEKQKVLW